MVGYRSGIMTFQKIFQEFAPSICAASLVAELTPERPATYRMIVPPKPFHTDMMTMTHLARKPWHQNGSFMKFDFPVFPNSEFQLCVAYSHSRLSVPKIPFITPVEANISLNVYTMEMVLATQGM